MPLIEKEAKTILRKQKQIDSWFCSSYGMNLYRGCAHNCIYCDGRSETYYVEGDFGSDIEVKINAPAILRRELDPARKRKPMGPGFILLGGGVNDCYQPAEKKYRLARQTLNLIYRFGHPVHVLTKSAMVLEDLELLRQINRQSRALLSVSISTADDSLAAFLEPGASPPSVRLDAVRRAKDAGLAAGVYLLPIIPFITDTPDVLDRSFRAIRQAGADFVIFGGLTLKEGRQRDHLIRALQGPAAADIVPGDPADIMHQYEILYPGDPWGNPVPEYTDRLHELFFTAASGYRLPVRIPPEIFTPVVDETGKVQIMLEHMDYVYRGRGMKSTYGYAARSIAKLDQPIRAATGNLKKLRGINGIGPSTERFIREILETGKSFQYEAAVCSRNTGYNFS